MCVCVCVCVCVGGGGGGGREKMSNKFVVIQLVYIIILYPDDEDR